MRSSGHEICECLPPCTDTRYDPEISYASFPGHGFNLTRTFKRLVEKRNLSTGTDGTQYFKWVSLSTVTYDPFQKTVKLSCQTAFILANRLLVIYYLGQMWQYFMFTTKKRRECATELTSDSELKILSVISFSFSQTNFKFPVMNFVRFFFFFFFFFFSMCSCDGWTFGPWSRHELHQRHWIILLFLRSALFFTTSCCGCPRSGNAKPIYSSSWKWRSEKRLAVLYYPNIIDQDSGVESGWTQQQQSSSPWFT